MARQAYREVRDLVERNGGTMRFLRKRTQDGAWFVMLDGKLGVFPLGRRPRTEDWQRGYRGISDLYAPEQFPQLRDNALERLRNMLE